MNFSHTTKKVFGTWKVFISISYALIRPLEPRFLPCMFRRDKYPTSCFWNIHLSPQKYDKPLASF